MSKTSRISKPSQKGSLTLDQNSGPRVKKQEWCPHFCPHPPLAIGKLNLNIATWNVHNMAGNISDSETTKIDVVYGDCISYDLAICLFQETHINGESQIITREKGSFFLCGNIFPETYHYGLGFFVQKELLNYVLSSHRDLRISVFTREEKAVVLHSLMHMLQR